MTWPFAPHVTDAAISASAATFAAATPFPHVVLDGWFTESVLTEVERLFETAADWQSYEDGKRATSAVRTDSFFQFLNSPIVLGLMQQITGAQVVPDPTMRGGGLHVVSAGGRLGIHVDFNRHKTLPLERRINTILYLNRLWLPAWRGQLTLTDRQGSDQHIAPLWNRWVIFKYGPESWHGHPEPLTCPPGVERRSAAVYYYRPLVEDVAFTGTQYA